MLVLRFPFPFLRVAQIILCFLIISASMGASSVEGQNRPVGQAKIGRAAESPSTMAPEFQQDKYGCNEFPAQNCSVFPQKKTLVATYVEYNPQTCALISSGSWQVTTNPKDGTTDTGIFTGYLANGDCPGTKFPFAALYYKWTSTEPKATTDSFPATWTSTDPNFPPVSETFPITLLCGAPTIMFKGANVANQDTPTDVVIGQQIMLSGNVPNPACVSKSQEWSFPGGSAVGGATETDLSGFTLESVPSDNMLTSYGPFYWTSQGTYEMTYQYTLNYGVKSAKSVGKFKVQAPTEVALATALGAATVVVNPPDLPSGTYLEFGNAPNKPGIKFAASAKKPPGYFEWVQLITNDAVTVTLHGKAQPCIEVLKGAGTFPALDSSYPYAFNVDSTSDSPIDPLTNRYTKVSRDFSATMYLMWNSGLPKSIPVPLGSVQWGFTDSAKLTNPTKNTWAVSSGSGYARSFFASSSYPTWASFDQGFERCP